MNLRWWSDKTTALLLFGVGAITTLLLFLNPISRHWLEGLGNTGYYGAGIAGVFYGISLTASFATAIFTQLHGVQPLVAAVLGGFGALLYDLAVFFIFRRAIRSNILSRIEERLQAYRGAPRWAILVAGALILASPLPDELAAGLMGVSHIQPRLFVLMSFVLNTIGILAIILLSQAG